MKHRPHLSLLILLTLAAGLLSNCTRDPNVRKAQYLKAGARFFEKGKYHEAVLEYRNAIKIDPRYAEAHYQLAQCYIKLGIWRGAYSELERTVELEPNHWKARIDRGNLLLATRETDRALEDAQRVLAANPNNADAHALLANIRATQGDKSGSLQEIHKAIEIDPSRRELRLNLALLQDAAQKTAAAEATYKYAIQLDPKSAVPALALANFYAQHRRWSEAEQQFQQAIRLDPKAPAARAALARLYMLDGKSENAEGVLKQAKQELGTNGDAYRLLGDFYVSTGNLNQAQAEYATLVREHPDDLRVKKNYVQILILQNQLDEATKLNDQVLKQNAGDVDALICRGQVLTNRGHPNEAVVVLQSALKSDPDNSAARYQLARAFSLSGDLTRAEGEWRELVREHPDALEGQRALAEVAVRKGDFDLLAETAEALTRLEPAAPQGYVLRATARMARKNAPGAEADLKRAISIAPQHPVAYARLGMLRLQQKRWHEAEKFYEQALQRDPAFTEALQGLAATDLLGKKPDRALTRVREQIARVPGDSAFYLLEAELLVRLSKLDEAQAALEKALDADRNNSEALLMLGHIEQARGSMATAVATYRRFLQERPRDVRVYMLLGSLEERQANWQEAEKLYKKALEIDPDYSLAANNLAYLMLQQGENTDVALSLAQAARTRMPEDPHIADTLARAYCEKGAYATAIELLKQALEKSPDNPTYHYHLGLAYQKMKDRALAKQHLQRALQLDSNYAAASEIRKALAQLAGS